MTNLYAHLNLAIGAPRRLAILKRAFEQAHAKNAHHRSQSWRDMRYATFKDQSGAGLCQSYTKDGQSWYTQNGAQFRREWFCDEVPNGPRIDHTGWYCDAYGEKMARGIVALLPHGRFIAGYWMSGNDERVYFGEIFDAARDAALMADEHARVISEQEAEHNERFNAAQKLEDENEQAFNRLRECLALRNNACFTALRDEARELIETIKGNRETLATEYKGVL